MNKLKIKLTKRQKLMSKILSEQKIQINTPSTTLQKIQAVLNIANESNSKLKTQSIEICFHLGTDAKKTDQNVKTSVLLPHGWKSIKKIGLFTPNETSLNNENITVGGLNLIESIKTSKVNNFDICVAHTSLEKSMNSIAKILQKTSPNKKYGTLTDNCEMIAKQIGNNELKLISNEKNTILTTIGNTSMTAQQIFENLCRMVDAINACKPAKLKTNMIQNIFISATQIKNSISISMREFSIAIK